MNVQDNKMFFLLDAINPHAIRTWIKRHQDLIDYNAQHYAFFASRRSQVMEGLKKSLLEVQETFLFEKPWRRIVSHQHSNTPLSTVGSVLHLPGGRFNIGQIDVERFPQFPALYLAEDVQTAYLECFGLVRDIEVNGLTADELVVAGNFSHFNIIGKLEKILNLTKLDSLAGFYNLIKDIELPIYFRREANRLKVTPNLPVSSLKELYDSLFREKWRLAPMQFDVPANSQIIGQIACSAGLDGILFPSSKNGHNALCVFPQNFKASEAYIEISGNVAESVKSTRIDKDTYMEFLPVG